MCSFIQLGAYNIHTCRLQPINIEMDMCQKHFLTAFSGGVGGRQQ